MTKSPNGYLAMEQAMPMCASGGGPTCANSADAFAAVLGPAANVWRVAWPCLLVATVGTACNSNVSNACRAYCETVASCTEPDASDVSTDEAGETAAQANGDQAPAQESNTNDNNAPDDALEACMETCRDAVPGTERECQRAYAEFIDCQAALSCEDLLDPGQCASALAASEQACNPDQDPQGEDPGTCCNPEDPCAYADNGECECEQQQWDQNDCAQAPPCCSGTDPCAWGNNEVCDCPEQAWDASDCTGPSCTAGSWRCNEERVEVCSSGEWTATTDCAQLGRTCVMQNESAFCATEEPACTFGHQRCASASSVERCSTSGTWVVVESCPAGATCVESASEAACEAPLCEQDAKRCAYGNVERCEQGEQWVVDEVCPSGAECVEEEDDAVCVAQAQWVCNTEFLGQMSISATIVAGTVSYPAAAPDCCK